MVNLGSSTSTKEHERISGNVVITSFLSGSYVNTSISGNTVVANVYVSGIEVYATVSGDSIFVYISGGSILSSVSGQTVIAKISGETVLAKISGDTVIAKISGDTIIAKTSGDTHIAKISGEVVNISGNAVRISGDTVIAKVSGDTVIAKISGDTVTVIGSPTSLSVWSSGAGAVATTLSNTNTNYLSYVEYSATSGVTTSSEFYITHTMAGYAGYPVKILSLNMATDATSSLLFTPDTPMILLSGDQVSIVYSNPNSCSWNTRIVAVR